MVKIDKREWGENIFITFHGYFDMINFRMLPKGVEDIDAAHKVVKEKNFG